MLGKRNKTEEIYCSYGGGVRSFTLKTPLEMDGVLVKSEEFICEAAV
jgi:hypothetical protein